MAIDNLIEVEYKTGNLSHEKIREGILKNKKKLTQMGYQCRWTEDLDLNANPTDAEMRNKGYSPTPSCIITSFHYSGLPYTISIFPKSKRASVFGNSTVYERNLTVLRERHEELQKAIGIKINLKQTSEPYKDWKTIPPQKKEELL